MAEYIEREALQAALMRKRCGVANQRYTEGWNDCLLRVKSMVSKAPAVDVEKMSDGYHTFADLYEQRLILSAALAKNNPHAWKSKRHEDGSVPFGGGWFIMGFDTDEGCYTYHYELKDWDLFQCKELDKGKPWDGHTSKDVRRLLSIPAADVAPVVHGVWIPVHESEISGWNPEVAGIDPIGGYICSACKNEAIYDCNDKFVLSDYCPNCGARMDGDENGSNDCVVS